MVVTALVAADSCSLRQPYRDGPTDPTRGTVYTHIHMCRSIRPAAEDAIFLLPCGRVTRGALLGSEKLRQGGRGHRKKTLEALDAPLRRDTKSINHIVCQEATQRCAFLSYKAHKMQKSIEAPGCAAGGTCSETLAPGAASSAAGWTPAPPPEPPSRPPARPFLPAAVALSRSRKHYCCGRYPIPKGLVAW